MRQPTVAYCGQPQHVVWVIPTLQIYIKVEMEKFLLTKPKAYLLEVYNTIKIFYLYINYA